MIIRGFLRSFRACWITLVKSYSSTAAGLVRVDLKSFECEKSSCSCMPSCWTLSTGAMSSELWVVRGCVVRYDTACIPAARHATRNVWRVPTIHSRLCHSPKCVYCTYRHCFVFFSFRYCHYFIFIFVIIIFFPGFFLFFTPPFTLLFSTSAIFFVPSPLNTFFCLSESRTRVFAPNDFSPQNYILGKKWNKRGEK